MNKRLLMLAEEIVQIRTAAMEQPGDVFSITDNRVKYVKRGQSALFDLILVEKSGSRWKAYVWDQTASNGAHVESSAMSIPEKMLQPAIKRYSKEELRQYLEDGQKKWGLISESRGQRRQQRRDISQKRYERGAPYAGELEKGQTYYWPASTWGYEEGIFTGEILGGKAKMDASAWAATRALYRGKKPVSTIWVLLDRLFKRIGDRYVRVLSGLA